MEETRRFLKSVREIITKKDYDWLHVIAGPEGIGKTSLGGSMCKEIDPRFRLDKDSIFSYDDMVAKIKKSYPGKSVLIDEGALIFFSRDYASTKSKDAVKLLTTMRSFNLFVVVCIPNFWILDKYIREHRVKTLSRVVKRGWNWHYCPDTTRDIKRYKNSFKTIWPGFDFRDTYPDYAKLYPEEWEAYKKKKAESTLNQGRKKREEPVPMVCDNCGWQWKYTGLRENACCPSCKRSIKVTELE